MRKYILLNAIIWAAAILILSYLFKENEYWTYIFGSLLVSFSLTQAYLTKKLNKKRKDCC